MIEAPICPVCNCKLRATGVNPAMFYCPKRRVWVSDLGSHLDVVDATIYITPDGHQTHKIIEVPPYSFTITDDGKIKKTEVRKIIPQERFSGLPLKRKSKTFDRRVVLTLDAIMKLPWSDKDKVLERMKLYLLFS